MATFIFRCPNTGRNVQGWIADDPEKGEGFYAAVTCRECNTVHLVDPETGNVLGKSRLRDM
jgi:hypothetical protein